MTLPRTDTGNERPYDEVFAADGRHRPAYEALAKRLGWDPSQPPSSVVDNLRGRPLGDDHQVAPVPLALPQSEYRDEIQAGVAQRARALQMFFADVFLGEGRYLCGGSELTSALFDEILASVGTSLAQLRQWWLDHDPEEIRFVYAPDLMREPGGRWVVIEDNIGCVGGCADSYFVPETYKQATGLPREPLTRADLSHAVSLWLERLGLTPQDPAVVGMLSDGDALAAYLPKRFQEDRRRINLMRQLGVRVIDDPEFERICQEPDARNHLKAVVNLGVPSRKTWWLVHDVAFDRLRLPLLNAPGTLLLGHKAFLPFVDGMIGFYCDENPILQSPRTSLLRDGLLPKNLDDWVLKTATGCQGNGVFILNSRAPQQCEEIEAMLKGPWTKAPAVIQRRVTPSRLHIDGATYDVELRILAYVIGWQRVFVGEQSIGKLAPAENGTSVTTVFSGGSYAAVILDRSTDDQLAYPPAMAANSLP